MNKFVNFAAITLLACVSLTSSVYAGCSVNWSSATTSYEFVQVDVPAACSVSIYATTSTTGGTYGWGGMTGVWYSYTFLPIPTNQDGTQEAGIVQSDKVWGFWDGLSDPIIYSNPYASIWVNVWGGGGNYSKEEYRSTDAQPYSSEYGQATAGRYYIDFDSNTSGTAFGYAIVDINW